MPPKELPGQVGMDFYLIAPPGIEPSHGTLDRPVHDLPVVPAEISGIPPEARTAIEEFKLRNPSGATSQLGKIPLQQAIRDHATAYFDNLARRKK